MKRILITVLSLAIIIALGYAVYYLITSDSRVSIPSVSQAVDLSVNEPVSGWREENRTGVSSETGLLKTWPENGPQLVWSVSDLPKGHSSVTFGNNTIYLTGNTDQNDVLVALDESGKIKWKTAYGRAWTASNPESRCTPTVEADRVYVSSGYGDLACLDGISGEIIWSQKASEIYNGTYGQWGIAESLIVDGNKVYYSPGGPETMTVALDKNTGELIWKSESLNSKPGYVSPILIEYSGIKMLVNVSLTYIYGLDTADGKILWKIDHENTVDHSGYMDSWPGLPFIKCVTPVYNNGRIYVTGGYNTGGVMLDLTDDGNNVTVAWTDSVLDVHHGGVVLIDGYLYGSNWLSNGDGNWCCINWNNGKKLWEEHWKNKGSIIYADGLLYIYDERNGNVGLLRPDTEKFNLVSTFRVKEGSGPYWAHPVIHNSILYLRHGEALMAYDIKEK